MTEPQSKEAKAAGELSETAKAELVKIYNQEKYGRRTEIITRYMDKGIQAEQDSIDLLSRNDERIYIKNVYTIENEFIKGTPDVISSDMHDHMVAATSPEFVIDIKTSWNLDSFQANEHKKVDKDYYWQIMGYMALTGAIRGEICYCLVNTPASILNGELYRLQSRMDVATNENPDFKIAAAELEFNHIFDDIPEDERIIRIPVDYNEEEIQKVYAKVEKCRLWLMEFDQKKINRKKPLHAA
jgi:hypothetical protein